MPLFNTFNFLSSHPLTRHYKIQAFCRYVLWQIKSRLYRIPFRHKFVNDSYLLVTNGMTGATGNIYTGLHEFNDMGFLLHFLREEDLFVDIGANVGTYTVLASSAIGSRTICFEPDIKNFEWINANAQLNAINTLVEINNVALGESEQELVFSEFLDTVNHIIAEGESLKGIKVKVLPLDTFLESRNPSLIKIDVEGYETNVISGATITLQNPALKAIIIELNGSGNRYGFDEKQIHEKLLQQNFLPYSYEPFSRELKLVSSFGSHNTIYIRDIDFVKERIKSAPAFSVLNYKI